MRRWRASDRAPFAVLNADPVVMRFFPATLSRPESDALVERIEAGFAADGFGLWALELSDGGELVGFAGLQRVATRMPFAPAVEVGWRLARHVWGRGYATEAARAGLAFGFGEAALDEVVSFTSVTNERSRAVMERLGMRRDRGEDFEHPRLPAGSPLRRHALYRLTAAQWRAVPSSGGVPPAIS